jgi:predicted ArsR family transcriptional regulator
MSGIITSDRTADRLLFLLKTHGQLTTGELARRLRISVPAVRGHLTRFAADGLVVFERLRAGVGRPAQSWALTDAAQARFPNTHAETLVEVLAALRETLGEPALQRVIDARSRDTETEYRTHLDACRSLAERIAALAALRTRDGYMAELRATETGWVLAEQHCPICAAARACQQFCKSELEMFRRLLGPDVEVDRTDYLLAGARRCAYVVRIVRGG